MDQMVETSTFFGGGSGHTLLLLLVFFAAAGFAGALAFLILRRDSLADRLNRLVTAPQTYLANRPRLTSEESKGLLSKVSKPLHALAAPSEEAIKKKTRLKLVQAGFRSNQAYHNFWAAKAAGTILLPLVWFLRGLFVSFDLKTMGIGLALAALGYFLPDIVVLQFRQKRQERIFKGVPDALDMMVVCVEAGLGLDMTFKRVGEEIRSLSPDLSDEFLLANLEVRAGKQRDDALRNMSQRTGVQEVQNLATVLIQSSRFGTSLAKALRVHAEGMRTKRRQMAEEIAAKSSVKLLFPLLLFIFPTMFVVLLGPAAIQIWHNIIQRSH